jgi:uncharacterized repeat protein (TIGR03803 family)
MTIREQYRTWTSRRCARRIRIVALVITALTVLASSPVQAQTFTVLHRFSDGLDGATPVAGVTLDATGNLYGTASYGGIGPCSDSGGFGCGTVFSLSRSGSGWFFRLLQLFTDVNGDAPSGKVVFGPDGGLYGTALFGGPADSGLVYNLPQPSSFCRSISCLWTNNALHVFTGGTDGEAPIGDLIFDNAGNMYGVTFGGGQGRCPGGDGCGIVYELTPSSGGWTETILYRFAGTPDGGTPYAGLVLDESGNLYGTTSRGGTANLGTVFQLVPSGPGWTENVLYSFQGQSDGSHPRSSLIFDQSGNLYGTTQDGGPGGGGTVFELAPSGGGWRYSLIFGLAGNSGPIGSLTLKDGALYGTTYSDGANGQGSVFKLIRAGGVWTYTSLHDFVGGSDGAFPQSSVAFDSNGNLFGTASAGGNTVGCTGGCGVVWEIMP